MKVVVKEVTSFYSAIGAHKGHERTIYDLVKENVFDKGTIAEAHAKDSAKLGAALGMIESVGVNEFSSAVKQIRAMTGLDTSRSFIDDPEHFATEVKVSIEAQRPVPSRATKP